MPIYPTPTLYTIVLHVAILIQSLCTRYSVCTTPYSTSSYYFNTSLIHVLEWPNLHTIPS